MRHHGNRVRALGSISGGNVASQDPEAGLHHCCLRQQLPIIPTNAPARHVAEGFPKQRLHHALPACTLKGCLNAMILALDGHLSWEEKCTCIAAVQSETPTRAPVDRATQRLLEHTCHFWNEKNEKPTGGLNFPSTVPPSWPLQQTYPRSRASFVRVVGAPLGRDSLSQKYQSCHPGSVARRTAIFRLHIAVRFHGHGWFGR